MSNIYEEIKELQKKVARYENRKENDDKLNELLTRIIDTTTEAKKMLTPTIKIATQKEPRSGGKNKELANEIYQKMLDGMQIDSNFIQITYNVSQGFASSILHKIANEHKNNVDKRRDKMKVYYYAKKEM